MLNPEDRLAIPHAGHERKKTQYGYSTYWTQASKFDMMNRLGEYEDTGLTPKEINEFMLKYITHVGDIVEYMGTAYEVVAFEHNFAHNLICLQSLNDDRHHEIDLPVYLFSPDYKRRS